jgi:phosphoribosylanthranilate isomerase
MADLSPSPWGSTTAAASWPFTAGPSAVASACWTCSTASRPPPFVVTDISRDGTLAGPDVDGLAEVSAATTVPVVASGDVGTLDDLRACRRAGSWPG